MEQPICYYVGRWGKDDTFHYVAETTTLDLAQAVAAMTGHEVLSDDDPRADTCNYVRDYEDSITGDHQPVQPTA